MHNRDDIEVLQERHFNVTTKGQRVCVDAWISVWAAVDVDGHVIERVKLLRHKVNTMVCGKLHVQHCSL